MYFGGLVLLYELTQRFDRRSLGGRRSMSGLARAFRRASVPLAAYYAVTLALPFANGAARSGTLFVKHALVVILVPLLAVALGGAIHAIYARRSAPHSSFDFRMEQRGMIHSDV